MSNEISKTQKQELSVEYTNAPRQGFEVPCQREDLVVPRAKLFQGLPTEYEEYPDAKPGQILNNITKEVLPSVFVPLLRHIEWIRFNPRDAKDPNFDVAFGAGEVIWRSTDPNDPRVVEEAKWGPNGEKPKALKFLSFLSYMPGASMPIVISFFKTSYNAGKAVNSVLEYSKGAMYEHSFRLTSKMTKSDQYSYYILQATYAGKTAPEDLERCKELYSTFIKGNIQAKAEFVE